MKAVTIVRFGCRVTKKIYEVGDEFTGTDERVNELVKKGKVEVKEKAEKSPVQPKAEVKATPKKEK